VSVSISLIRMWNSCLECCSRLKILTSVELDPACASALVRRQRVMSFKAFILEVVCLLAEGGSAVEATALIQRKRSSEALFGVSFSLSLAKT